MAILKVDYGSIGGGGGAAIEYIDNITSGSGSSSKTVNFKTGTYARDDYASLTEDNFLIIPHRSSSGVSASWSGGGQTSTACTTTAYSHKNYTYDASTGILTFYGGMYTQATRNDGSTVTFTASATANYDIYIIKPALSQVVS